MSVSALPLYRADGRIRGCYVYMLLCRDDGDVYVKVGITEHPHDRMLALRRGCPVTPRRFCFMEVCGREYAKEVELALHLNMDKWRVHGEWFRVPMADKGAFNAAWKSVLALKERPNWPGRWEQIAVAPYVADGERKRRFYQRMIRRRGTAYKDFTKHLHSSGGSGI